MTRQNQQGIRTLLWQRWLCTRAWKRAVESLPLQPKADLRTDPAAAQRLQLWRTRRSKGTRSWWRALGHTRSAAAVAAAEPCPLSHAAALESPHPLLQRLPLRLQRSPLHLPPSEQTQRRQLQTSQPKKDLQAAEPAAAGPTSWRLASAASAAPALDPAPPLLCPMCVKINSQNSTGQDRTVCLRTNASFVVFSRLLLPSCGGGRGDGRLQLGLLLVSVMTRSAQSPIELIIALEAQPVEDVSKQPPQIRTGKYVDGRWKKVGR